MKHIALIHLEFMKSAVAPPGWGGTVEKMKEHKDISNPWALAWWMSKQKKGDKWGPGGELKKKPKPHYKEKKSTGGNMKHIATIQSEFVRLAADYKEYFDSKMSEYGVSSPTELTNEQWEQIDSGWTADHESDANYFKN